MGGEFQRYICKLIYPRASTNWGKHIEPIILGNRSVHLGQVADVTTTEDHGDVPEGTPVTWIADVDGRAYAWDLHTTAVVSACRPVCPG